LLNSEIDAGSSYRIQPASSNLPYITLPKEINLSSQSIHADNPEVRLSIGDTTYFPEPLVYYATVLKQASNPKGAAAFYRMAQKRRGTDYIPPLQYDPPGDALLLHACA
jgi:molybdate/tungstate transport system substrate-binding protein